MVELDSRFHDQFRVHGDFHRPVVRYHALIECPDGDTYIQPYDEIEDLINLADSLGDGYSIQEIW